MSVDTEARERQQAGPVVGGDLRRNLIVLVGVTVVLALLPLLLPEARQGVAARTLIFAIMGVGWNVMSGYGGMFSFGHAAFFGIGAYTDAYLLVEHGISPWLSLVVGAALAALFGVAIGWLCLRYRLEGAYFALATFAFAQMLLLLASNSTALQDTRGFNIPILSESSWLKMQFPVGSPNYLWIVSGLLVLALAVNLTMAHVRTGQYIMAIRDDHVAAESLSIPVMRYQLAAVAVSAAITATAGVFYTQYYLYVNPENAFGANVSVEAIVPAVIGGIGTLWGPLIGAAVIGPLSEVTASVLRSPPAFLSFLSGRSGLDVAIYATLIIVIVIFLPKGIYGSIRDRWRR